MTKLHNACKGVLLREFTLYYRCRNEVFNTMLYFVVISSFLLIGIENLEINSQLATVNIILTSLFLAVILAQENLFRTDYHHGIYTELLLSPSPQIVLIFFKLMAIFILTCTPIILFIPIITTLYNFHPDHILALLATILILTPAINFLASIGVALTLTMARGGLLLPIMLLPIYLPLLLIANSIMYLAFCGLNFFPQLAILAAISILIITFTPPTIYAIIKVSVQ